MRHHIESALAALDSHDAVGARREIAAARRALGLWGRPMRTLDQVAVSIATTTNRETLAEWLAVAAEAMEGDTWPGNEPYDVREFLASDHVPAPGDCPDNVIQWLEANPLVQPGVGRAALVTALSMLHDR